MIVKFLKLNVLVYKVTITFKSSCEVSMVTIDGGNLRMWDGLVLTCKFPCMIGCHVSFVIYQCCVLPKSLVEHNQMSDQEAVRKKLRMYLGTSFRMIHFLIKI
jgi:hypothetical protein